MISKSSPTECFVYITLPGRTDPVTAGRFQLSVTRSGTPVGHFIYGRSYTENREAVEIDPVELKLARGVTYETTGMKGVFGAIRDAGPDYWGRTIIERHAGKAPLGELDYLLESPDDRAGALGFGLGQQPPAPRRKFNQTIELAKLQEIADSLVRQDDKPVDAAAAPVQELLLLGTSMGGARPKAVVEDKDGLWIAKFNTPHDRWNDARVEHTMLKLARSCGLAVADSKVVDVAGRDVLLVKRFDRTRTDAGYLRARMVSALTLLRADDTHNSRDRWSYVLLAEELRRATSEPERHARELFRRMVFNALISNTDDHPRNHAILAADAPWRLSPAYDLTPNTPVSVERRDLALICGDAGRYANARNMLSQCARFLLSPDEAAELIAQMKEAVRSTWYATARDEGITDATANSSPARSSMRASTSPCPQRLEMAEAELEMGENARPKLSPVCLAAVQKPNPDTQHPTIEALAPIWDDVVQRIIDEMITLDLADIAMASGPRPADRHAGQLALARTAGRLAAKDSRCLPCCVTRGIGSCRRSR